MEFEEKNANKAVLKGEIISDAVFSHEIYKEGFYEMKMQVKRLSNQFDILPLTISERLIEKSRLQIGSELSVSGQFRSYNKIVDGKSKLMLTVFVREVLDYESVNNPNEIALNGYICKKPIYRTTPFNREIADILLAVNRAYNKSDYIPCIAWGRNARFAKGLELGEKVTLNGRIQSREYQKKISDDCFKNFTAYEVSVGSICSESFGSLCHDIISDNIYDNI